MLTWVLALANGVVFTLSIWLSHAFDFSQWWHWLAVAVAGIIVISITAAKGVRADREGRRQANAHQFNRSTLERLEKAVERIENRETRDAVLQALGDYYEEIMCAVEGMQVSAGMRGVLGVNRLGGANIGWVPRRGPNVRDIIPAPDFDK